MNSSSGLKETNFDVLQNMEKDPFEYKVPLKKVGFDDFPKPTELDPEIEMSETEKDFSIPKDLIDHLDFLIVKKKLPLRTLKFDIEFSKSIEEIAEHLHNYLENSTIIPETELDKLFSLIGYGRNTSSTGKIEEPVKEKSFFDDPVDEKHDLKALRDNYAKLRFAHLNKIREAQIVYKKMMSELGGNSEMPKKEETKELQEARAEYRGHRRSVVNSISENVDEIQELQNAYLESTSEKNRNRIDKALSDWEDNSQKTSLSEVLLMNDYYSIEKMPEATTFEGLRASKNTKDIETNDNNLAQQENKQEISPVDIKVAEKPALPQNDIPLEFEGKNLVISIVPSSDFDEMRVVYDGVLIAVGKMAKRGPDIKIKPEFKAGFLLAPTIQQKALKFAVQKMKEFVS